jgi:hypothetical protein
MTGCRSRTRLLFGSFMAIGLVSYLLASKNISAQEKANDYRANEPGYSSSTDLNEDYLVDIMSMNSGVYTQRIKALAANSSCAKYSWKNRGRAPAGYIKGVALSFARSVCRLKTTPPSSLTSVLAAADSHNDRKDVLTHYRNILSALQLTSSVPGEDTMRTVYTIGMGLGMRESSGAYCVGWDTSAGSNRPSSAAEAGAFQVSYDSIVASSELRKLYNEYSASPQRCFLDVFKEGASCGHQSILGSGAGASFQSFNKACPAFATEYAMTLLRVLRGHFGPINRLEAQVVPACNALLKDVQQLIDADPNGSCQEIF